MLSDDSFLTDLIDIILYFLVAGDLSKAYVRSIVCHCRCSRHRRSLSQCFQLKLEVIRDLSCPVLSCGFLDLKLCASLSRCGISIGDHWCLYCCRAVFITVIAYLCLILVSFFSYTYLCIKHVTWNSPFRMLSGDSRLTDLIDIILCFLIAGDLFKCYLWPGIGCLFVGRFWCPRSQRFQLEFEVIRDFPCPVPCCCLLNLQFCASLYIFSFLITNFNCSNHSWITENSNCVLKPHFC